jgi:hypothetical protein
VQDHLHHAKFEIESARLSFNTHPDASKRRTLRFAVLHLLCLGHDFHLASPTISQLAKFRLQRHYVHEAQQFNLIAMCYEAAWNQSADTIG